MHTPTFSTLQEHHLQPAIRLITSSFLSLNSLWNRMAPSEQDVSPVVRGYVLSSLKSGWSFVILREGKVIGCSLNVDLLQYLSMPQMPSQLDLFRKIGEAGRHLEGQLNLSSFKAGEVCYGMMGCVDPKEAGKQAATLFWLYQVTLGKLAGWKYFFSRISSPVSLRLLQKMGGEVIAETEIAGLEGEQKMWMVKIDLRKPDCSPSQMRQSYVPPGPKL